MEIFPIHYAICIIVSIVLYGHFCRIMHYSVQEYV